jgi:hypothetical protein
MLSNHACEQTSELQEHQYHELERKVWRARAFEQSSKLIKFEALLDSIYSNLVIFLLRSSSFEQNFDKKILWRHLKFF